MKKEFILKAYTENVRGAAAVKKKAAFWRAFKKKVRDVADRSRV